MSDENPDAYQVARNKVLTILFGRPVMGIALASVVVALVAAGFLLDFLEKANKGFGEQSVLEIVEVRPIATEGFPILDIKMRNPGSTVAFLKAIDFEVVTSALEYAEPHQSSGAPVTEQYNVIIPTSQGSRVQLAVSQAIPKDSVDRIQVIVGASESYGIRGAAMQLRLHFHYNESDSVTSDLVALKVISHEFFEHPERIPALTLSERLVALEQGNPSTRADVARVLGDIGEQRAIPALLQRLSDEDENVVALAALSLGKLRAPNALPTLTELFERDYGSNSVQWRVVQAIGFLGDPRGRETLKGFYARSDIFVRKHIVASLKQLGETDFSDILPYAIQAIETDRDGFIWGNVDILVEMGDRRAIPALEKAYCRQPDRYREQASLLYKKHIQEALARFGETDLTRLLCAPADASKAQ